MKILAIDTTNTTLTVVVIDGETSMAKTVEVGKSGHSLILVPTVELLMKVMGLTPQELDCVAVVVGPGSFTGIRIGVSAATALSFDGQKRIAVNYFELLAYNREKITACVDAGHGNLYVADCENGKVIDTKFIEAEDAKSLNMSDFVSTLDDKSETVLEKVVRKKYENGEFSSVFEPYYMRKSQAERNLK